MHAYNRSIWEAKAGDGELEARLDYFKGENVKLESRDKVNHEPQDLSPLANLAPVCVPGFTVKASASPPVPCSKYSGHLMD